MTDLTEKRLGEFQLLRRLGSGGMAEVFLAEQTSLQRYVAVKVMKPSLMAQSRENLLAHFRQEAMMAAGLNHPNIVQVYTIGHEGGLHYIAQEYVEGSDLATLLRERGKLDLSSALHVMRQVAAALKASGKAGIVHRDIKPENILVNKKGEIKVADFGLAQLGKSSDDNTSDQASGVTMGTPLYMSPEQVRGRELDPRSDVYSFGVTCYQLLSGDTPFRGATPVQIAMQHLNNAPPPLHEKNPAIPKVLCRLVHRMMAKRRSLRYQSAEEVLEDLKTLIAAQKQGRSLDLVRLPRLEELERLAEQERQKTAQPIEGEVEVEVIEDEPASNSGQADPGRSARAPFQLANTPAPAPAEDDDDDPPPRRARAEESAAIDLTPAVDVTFQLLIFFMVTASFSMQKAFDVPPAKQTEGVSVAVVVQDESQTAVKVQVDADNSMIVEEQDSKRASNYRELLELLKAEKNASPDVTDIQLELHPDSTHETRVIVIDAATQAGFTRVRNKVIEW